MREIYTQTPTLRQQLFVCSPVGNGSEACPVPTSLLGSTTDCDRDRVTYEVHRRLHLVCPRAYVKNVLDLSNKASGGRPGFSVPRCSYAGRGSEALLIVRCVVSCGQRTDATFAPSLARTAVIVMRLFILPVLAAACRDRHATS